MYKLVVLDIDGTLLNSKEQLSDVTKNTINEVIKMGIPVCLCTGRNVHNTMRVVKALNLKTPFACIDGAVMYDPRKRTIIKQKNLHKNVADEIMLEVNKHNLYMEVCTYKNYIKFAKNDELAKYNYGGVPNSINDKIKDYFVRGARYTKSIESLISKNVLPNQILFAGQNDALKDATENIKARNYTNIEIRDDLWEEYVFITAKDAIKSQGVQMLCDYYGVGMHEVIAIGDQMNDIDMIQKAGLGIAMANGHTRILEIADEITATNDENGVAEALQKFILNV